jgi:hypothetical protein
MTLLSRSGGRGKNGRSPERRQKNKASQFLVPESEGSEVFLRTLSVEELG